MQFNNILEIIGNTPLLKLEKISPKGISIYAKLEGLNPAGSIKDRVALNMITEGEHLGLLRRGDIIVEPTSGNTGIGLAMIAAYKGYKAVFTMPETMSVERRKLLKAFGADIILTNGKLGMEGAVKKAEKLASQDGYFMPQQFKNPANTKAHIQGTGPELIADLGDIIPDYFIAGVGTGGTVSGIGKVLKEKYPNIKIIAVEPLNSAVLSKEKPGKHGIQGIGAGFIPPIYDNKIVDSIIKISDKSAIKTAKRIIQEEGVLSGISSGANVAAALQLSELLMNNNDKTRATNIITILPDTAQRYLSTALFTEEV